MKRIALTMAIMAALSTQAQQPQPQPEKKYTLTATVQEWVGLQQLLQYMSSKFGDPDATVKDQKEISKVVKNWIDSIGVQVNRQLAADTVNVKGGKK